MKAHGSRSCLVVAAALPLVGGCLAMGGGEKTRFDEAERIAVRFANRTASNAFYEGFANADRGDFTDGGGFFVLLLAGGGGSTFYETHFYNAQVRRADVDRDGEITEEEALGYRDAVGAESA
jgi:hypothetical protein